jgi:hypothetical protein
MEFGADKRDYQAFALMMKNAPKYYRAVMANFLNNMGFKLREIIQADIEHSMTVRNKGVVKRFTRVQKTGAVDIASQRVTVGTLRGERFSGWPEQEKGGPSERNRQIWIGARGGDPGKIVPKSNRLNQRILTADDAGITGTEGNRVIGFLSWLGRNQSKDLFRLQGQQYKGGIYKLTSGYWNYISKKGRALNVPKFVKVDQEGVPIKVKKNPIAERSMAKLLQGGDMPKLAEAAMVQAVERMKAKHL